VSFFDDDSPTIVGGQQAGGGPQGPRDPSGPRPPRGKKRGRFGGSGSGSGGDSGKRRERKPRSKRTVRIQRLLIALVVLFIVVFLLALWIRSCSYNRKVGSYQEYMTEVQKVIEDTNAVGKDLKTMVNDPTKFTREGMSKLLGEMIRDQTAVADRAAKLQPPDDLMDENAVLVQGMDVRNQGYKLWRDAIEAELKGKDSSVTAKNLAALGAYFTGPEAYYQALFYRQAQKVMADEGVSNVTVPAATYYTNANLFQTTKMKNLLDTMGKTSSLKGVHGVALAGVQVQPGDKQLETGKTNKVTASTELSFVVSVENQGTVAEKDVPVEITLIPPEEANLQNQKLETSIATIDANQVKTAKVAGFTLDPAVIGPELKLRVQVGPVPQEQVATNNKATYTVIFQL